eukprot:2254597-Amphidinium_carterae.1
MGVVSRRKKPRNRIDSSGCARRTIRRTRSEEWISQVLSETLFETAALVRTLPSHCVCEQQGLQDALREELSEGKAWQ